MRWYYPSVGPLPYESMFSIFIKLSHVNFTEYSALREITGSINLKPGVMRHWYKLKPTIELESIVPDLTNHLPFDFAPPKGLRDLSRDFAFCPECIRFGYHSVFNVIKFHDFCVLHKCRLSIACKLCTESYLRGFRFREPIPKLLIPCDKCGFADVGLMKEIEMRRNRHLHQALRSYGEKQAEWYSRVKQFHDLGSPYYWGYYNSAASRKNLTGPFEQAAEMESPERCAQLVTDSQRIFWLQHPKIKPERFSNGNRSCSLNITLEVIQHRYLASHRECLKCMTLLTEFPDGFCKKSGFCAVALAYILMLKKIECGDGPGPASVRAIDAGYGYSGDLRAKMGEGDCYRELRALFLSILGRLQFQISQCSNFFIMCHWNGEFSAFNKLPIYIRRSSYAFRNVCKISSANLEVTRYEYGGPIYVSSLDYNVKVFGKPTEQMII